RVINREDRREVRVIPTEKGRALQEPITKIIDEVNEEVLKCFSEEEVVALKNALRIIADGSHFK
ncbi:MAG: MarR family transcriptional regulator, partial [Anaerotignum sp.]|nr:MarR family transcriptional regulator [Anaerotignum sp.]